MPRVWKHFLKNLAWPFGFVAYVIAVSIGAAYADSMFKGGGLIVITLFIALPVLAYLIREMWRDAKREVEWENEEMMRRIKGGH